MQQLLKLAEEYSSLEKIIDNNLEALSKNLKTKKINDAIASLEDFLTIDSGKSPTTKYAIAGSTKLRFLLDDDAPTFSKVDTATMNYYRRKLLQYYHPDKETGSLEEFETTKKLFAVNNLEVLAIMASKIGVNINDSDIEKMSASLNLKLQQLKLSNSFKIVRLIKSGRTQEDVENELQRVLDKKADVINLMVLGRLRSQLQSECENHPSKEGDDNESAT